MNELDQFVKHKLKIKHYARYTDDFVIVADSDRYLTDVLALIQSYLSDTLRLKLHPKKVEIRKVRQGIDFLGYVILPHHKRLRTKTKRRIIRKMKKKVYKRNSGEIEDHTLDQTLSSYLGVLSHANTYKLTKKIKNQYWFLRKQK